MNPKTDISQLVQPPKSIEEIRLSINNLLTIDHSYEQIQAGICYWSNIHSACVCLEEGIEQPCETPEGGIKVPSMVEYTKRVAAVEMKKYIDLQTLYDAARQKELRL